MANQFDGRIAEPITQMPTKVPPGGEAPIAMPNLLQPQYKAGAQPAPDDSGRPVTGSDLAAMIMADPSPDTVQKNILASSPTTSGPVNSQITDAVTQANVKVLGEAPTPYPGTLSPGIAQALVDAAHNATGQQIPPTIGATAQDVNQIYSLDTASIPGSESILRLLQEANAAPAASSPADESK